MIGDKREFKRIPVNFQAIAYINRREIDCYVRNISVQGIGLEFLRHDFPDGINSFNLQFLDDNISEDHSDYYVADISVAIKHKEINENDNSHIIIGGIITSYSEGYYEYVCLKEAIRQKNVGFRSFRNGVMVY